MSIKSEPNEIIEPTPEWEQKAHESVQKSFVVFPATIDAFFDENCDVAMEGHFRAEFDLIDALGEFRNISCHPVWGLGEPGVPADECDGPYGIRLVAGTEGVLEHVLFHVYAELYDTERESDAGLVSDMGVQFTRYMDRRSVLIEYGIGDIPALLEAVELAKDCLGHSDFHRDHAVREQAKQ